MPNKIGRNLPHLRARTPDLRLERAAGAATLMLLCFLLPLAAQHESEQKEKKKNPAIGNPRAIEAGKKLFAASCGACHGADGKGGRGPNLLQRGAWHPLDDDGLFKTIEKGLPGGDMPPTDLPEDQLWQIVAYVRSLTSPAFENEIPGDSAAGEALFWGKAACNGCHMIRGRGGMLGPDLSNAGALRSLDQLREAILDPDADGALTYRGIKVIDKHGRSIEGVERNRTNYSLQVQDAGGNLHLLSMTDVREITRSKGSPMPKDYKSKLSTQEIEDLLAYLGRQSVRPREEKNNGELENCFFVAQAAGGNRPPSPLGAAACLGRKRACRWAGTA